MSPESVDLVMIPNVLFQVENKSAIIIEAYRILKNTGRLVIIDWIGKNMSVDISGQISKEEVIRLTEAQGFKLNKEFKAGRYHFGVVFTKS